MAKKTSTKVHGGDGQLRQCCICAALSAATMAQHALTQPHTCQTGEQKAALLPARVRLRGVFRVGELGCSATCLRRLQNIEAGGLLCGTSTGCTALAALLLLPT